MAEVACIIEADVPFAEMNTPHLGRDKEPRRHMVGERERVGPINPPPPRCLTILCLLQKRGKRDHLFSLFGAAVSS